MSWRAPGSIIAVAAVATAAASCGARTDLGGRAGGGGDAPIPLEGCGNAILSDGEACDDGNADDTDACLSTCVEARCGDGVLAKFEACDDGNAVNTDGCSNACELPTCGDGIVQAGEECDSPDFALCTPLCRTPKCGDGFIRFGVEQCDLGADNGDQFALVLKDGKTARPIEPVVRDLSALDFYDYKSASAHTGFEGVTTSNLLLYASPFESTLSLFTIHGIDLDSSGLSDGDCKVQQSFSGLPPGASVLFADDNPKELASGGSVATGDWTYHDNSDGGVIGGLPYPGTWSVKVDSAFLQGVDTWVYVDGDGAPLALDASFAILEAHVTGPACRLDCTIPACGDGIVDPGEVCDDGNKVSGDGCVSSCNAFD